jgi:hypothetical protein
MACDLEAGWGVMLYLVHPNKDDNVEFVLKNML